MPHLKGAVWEGGGYEDTPRNNLQMVLASELSFGHKRTMKARKRGLLQNIKTMSPLL